MTRLINFIRSWLTPAEQSLFEKAMAEVNRREAAARKAHRSSRIYKAIKRELVRRNLQGELR